MVIENIFQAHGFDKIIAYSGKDITEQMIDACFEIDRSFYEEEYYWEKSEIKEIVKTYGQLCFVFFDTEDKKVMGYSFWLPIKTKVFNAFIKEKIMLLNIKQSYCASYKENDHINLFMGGEAFVKGYNLKKLHKAVEDLFQKKILDLAYKGVKIKYIAIESCCQYDEAFLLPMLGFEKKVKKNKSTFYYDEYSPRKTYKDSKYVADIKQFYN